MAKFVPKEKLGKKARRALDRQKRVTWDCSPVTRTVASKKIYSRKRNAHDRIDLNGMGVYVRTFSFLLPVQQVSCDGTHQAADDM